MTARPASNSPRLSALLLAALTGCGAQDLGAEPWVWRLPEGQPAPAVPQDSPMTEARVELGRHLFYDVRLSGNGEQACASCHEQARAFTDGEVTPTGSTGDSVPRNSMTLTNVAYRNTLAWSNPALTDLESHALVPLFGEFPVELGLTGVDRAVLATLEDDPIYRSLFNEAELPFEMSAVVSALASFQRTLLSYDSPYDRWVAGDATALSASAQRGAALFFSEAAECYHCHGGFDFTNDVRTHDSPAGRPAFANTGLYNVGGDGRYPAPNVGLIEFTGVPEDMGRFRVPTLRNIAVTAPYMHDGSIETLADVILHYVRGGSLYEDGPMAGDGAQNPFKDSLIRPLSLDDSEQADLVAFLEALTDEAFLLDPRYADPW